MMPSRYSPASASMRLAMAVSSADMGRPPDIPRTRTRWPPAVPGRLNTRVFPVPATLLKGQNSCRIVLGIGAPEDYSPPLLSGEAGQHRGRQDADPRQAPLG